MSLSKMRIKDAKGKESQHDTDRIDSLFRYVAQLENRVNELERKEKATRPYFQKLFKKVKMARRVADGHPVLTPRQEKAAKRKGERKESVRRLFEAREGGIPKNEIVEVNDGEKVLVEV